MRPNEGDHDDDEGAGASGLATTGPGGATEVPHDPQNL
jgi:hypothetical protein